MMAKTASDILKGLSLKVKNITKDEAKSFDFLLDEIPMRIIRRTLLGKDINNGMLKALSANYILYREGKMSFRTSRYGSVYPIFNTEKISMAVGKTTKRKNKKGEGANTSIEFVKHIVGDKFKPPKLSSDTKPAKSNLTLTGEMLSSIEGKRSGSLFTFFFSNSFSSDKARWAKEGGRPFFGLSETDKKGLTTKISSIFRQILRDNFKG